MSDSCFQIEDKKNSTSDLVSAKGSFNGLDSTGKKVTIYETSIYRIANGKIVEQWGFPDALGLSHQLEPKK
ncbi:ester cyclase [Rhodocytophaga rosea]|uniref:Ester cyclase n=1 Tax=Rhodocytophaga rosea TaxID=2704465 RepID=A0A6C0GTL3_9BACT|nr:ester cyclase [Rhodocytophaga rosea]